MTYRVDQLQSSDELIFHHYSDSQYHHQNHLSMRESYISYLKFNRNKWTDNRPPSGANKSTRGGRVIGFSACKDNQLAADTSV